MAVAAVDHQDGRVLDRVVGRDRLGVRGHAFADNRVVAQATRKGAHQVSLGHDPREPSILHHEDRSDVALRHPLGRRDDRQPRLDGQ